MSDWALEVSLPDDLFEAIAARAAEISVERLTSVDSRSPLPEAFAPLAAVLRVAPKAVSARPVPRLARRRRAQGEDSR